MSLKKGELESLLKAENAPKVNLKINKHKLWEDPDKVKLASNASNNSTSPVSEEFEKIIEVDPKLVKIWDLKDRTRSKQKIDDLIEMIKEKGQLIPCIVREIKNSQYKYELIAGRRRFLAVKELGIKLKVTVKNLNDMEALVVQHQENKRDNPSDYDNGIHYQSLLDSGKIKSQLQLAKLFNEDPQYISKVLRFAKIPDYIQDAVGDFENVTASTAEMICSLVSKGQDYSNALVDIADKIREGKGSSTIKKLVIKIVNGGNQKIENFEPRRVFNKGVHIFTWTYDANGNIAVTFPINISKAIKQDKIEDNIKQGVLKCIGS